MSESPVPIEEAPPGDAPGGAPARATQTNDASVDVVQAGRDAFGRHDWQAAFDTFARADAVSHLSGPDLELWAEAAFFAGKAAARVEIKERAFAAYQEAGDTIRASYLALDIAFELYLRRRTSIASGWARRAERLLEGQPENYAHGYLALTKSGMARADGDIAAATDLAVEAVAIAGRTGHADLRAIALTALATMKIATGDTKEGFVLLEEAAVSAVSGELSPIIAGVTSCQMIAACRDLTDYRRASEWLEATDEWCKRQDVSGFPGVCRVHRAEIVALHGGWQQAEQELRQATSELAGYDAIPPMADGLYAIGDIRRLMGDPAGAEEALRQAHTLGRSPQPALALLRLADGKVTAAASAIDAALAESTWDQWERARLLAAQVEVKIAAGDVARARLAVDELGAIVETYPSPALAAGRQQAHGRVLLAEGDAPGAIRELRAAIGSWRDVGSPYEVARTRAVLAAALRSLGDGEDADFELGAARDEFQRLGARPDLTAVEHDLQEAAERRATPGQARKTFMFTDIVGSTSLAEALGNEAWERVLRWHDDTLRGLFGRHGGEVVNSTGDGFFVAFDSARRGVECAIAIQRALADHRTATGFVPPVRIGLHSAEATRRGRDYSGLAVHVASRISGLAGGGEVLASEETLTEAGDIAASATREVTVRGLAAALKVATVAWT